MMDFTAQFEQIRYLYEAAVRAWLGTGQNETNDDLGHLYVQFNDGRVTDLGLIDAYAYAVQGGYDGSKTDFEQTLGNTATYAYRAALAAKEAANLIGSMQYFVSYGEVQDLDQDTQRKTARQNINCLKDHVITYEKIDEIVGKQAEPTITIDSQNEDMIVFNYGTLEQQGSDTAIVQ